MARLTSLPIDILLIIVTHSLGELPSSLRRAAATNLALVCKRLYGICGHTLFHTYNLILRNRTHSAREIWQGDIVRARLAYLRSKAHFVRKLRIIDYGPTHDRRKSEPQDELPAEIIPELLHVLKSIPGVVDVSFKGRDCDPARRSPSPPPRSGTGSHMSGRGS
ncbi:hypothetical protein EVG20_g11559 [Dentipellis fragilis]|uniref:F-box domain-containing protein n=1 Tax=Dentipellis fragilis TaxID=205917 RepID=A0A4Y9XK97_9AGAM|nr:hypothetical protein EVG20_g11559 [Dentipellis fragilis]